MDKSRRCGPMYRMKVTIQRGDGLEFDDSGYPAWDKAGEDQIVDIERILYQDWNYWGVTLHDIFEDVVKEAGKAFLDGYRGVPQAYNATKKP